MKRSVFLTAVGLFFFSIGTVCAEEARPEASRAKTELCVACHGADGNSIAPTFPNLAGQNEAYLYDQLLTYKAGDKGRRLSSTAAQMYGMSAGFSNQELADLARYFSEQKSHSGVTEEKFLILGQKIYKGGNLESGVPACAACHGARGEGNEPAKYPRLSGQHASYVADQLRTFKRGERLTESGIMSGIAKRMTDEEIDAVSSYVSGLH